jgi:hypothetical protein
MISIDYKMFRKFDWYYNADDKSVSETYTQDFRRRNLCF